MRIGIDAHFLEQNYGGLTTFLKGISKEIPEADKRNEYFLFFQKRKPEKLTKNYSIIRAFNYLITKYYFPFWFNFVLPRELQDYKIDLFFSPNHFSPIRKMTEKEIIVIHDLAWRVNPNWKNLNYKTYAKIFQQKSIQRADRIIAVSENTKKDIIKFYNLPEEKIEVIYEAADEIFRPRVLSEREKEKLREIYNLPKEFVLYIGRIEERKNINTIIKVSKYLNQLNWLRNLKFVIIGDIGPGGRKYQRAIQDNQNIFWLKNVPEEDLPYIYNLAKIFLFPSFHEGFALPVLEAMQSGLPVLIANTSSLPEVVGEGGLVHDPNNHKNIVQGILRLIEDENFYKEMREKGIEQAKKFSWKKSAGKLVQIFNNV